MFRFFALTVSLCLALSITMKPASAQEASESEKQQAIEGMRFMLRRAEFVRLLAAQHLQFINENRDKTAFHTLEEASQVMAYNLICEDEQMSPRTLNNIAAQTTLQIAILTNESPAGKTMADAMQDMSAADRMVLLGDISSTVLMFKIGRRRGLFDALLTDFGNARFCSGMSKDMRQRYNALVASLPED